MKKVKTTIPVYDICSLSRNNDGYGSLIAEPFAEYITIHPNLHRAHRHSFYHMVLFTEGKGFHTIDFEQFPVQQGQIYFMAPGQVHGWNFKGEVDGYIINFSAELFSSLTQGEEYLQQFSFFKGIAKESVFKLKGKTYEEAKRLFQQIITETKSVDSLAPDMIRTLLTELFINVVRAHPSSIPAQAAPKQNMLILHNFRKLVNTYYAEKHLPKEYAAMLYITPNHLNALCNDLLGMQAGEVIRDRIVLEAKRLLVNAEMDIKEIAYQLHFTDNSHFSKFFKKHTTLAPEEFRNTSVGNNQ
jgi:AraC family transcriptional activator of pobA